MNPEFIALLRRGIVDNGTVSRFRTTQDISQAYATKWDKSTTNITYLGQAPIGTATSSPNWRIMKVDQTVTDQGTVTWASSGAFTATWDNRTSETYS